MLRININKMETLSTLLKTSEKPGVGVHIYNPALRVRVQSQLGLHPAFQASLVTEGPICPK